MPLVHAELRRLARRYMRYERPTHSLPATALVNEVYMRLVDIRRVRWRDRVHFFAVSARLMRRVLVDIARSRRYQKRGAGIRHELFDEALTVGVDTGPDIVALDDALTALAAVDARKSQVIELRFFGGLSVTETASALQVSPQTVQRDWRLAKAWLARELAGRRRA